MWRFLVLLLFILRCSAEIEYGISTKADPLDTRADNPISWKRNASGAGLSKFDVVFKPRVHGSAVEDERTLQTVHHSAWIYRLFLNVICYAVVFAVGWASKHVYFARGGQHNGRRGYWATLQRICFVGYPETNAHSGVPAKKTDDTLRTMPNGLKLTICCVGLQIFLPWGILQEKIMTKSYDGDRFEDAQFLVFSNRLLALLASGAFLYYRHYHQPPHRAPFYLYSFSSFSNIVSSWFQYEALKYVSFPTQILAKACKILPVMLMGKIINQNKYSSREYIAASLISIGMSVFLLSRWRGESGSALGALAGTVILIGYIVFDSFTSNWQENLKKEYNMTPVQIMFGTNLFSVLLISVSLIAQGGLFSGMLLTLSHPELLRDILVFSSCAALGQFFIFYTISSFGAVNFQIIMTVRTFFSVLLSYLFYDHEWTLLAFAGIVVVFIGLACEIYAKYNRSQTEKKAKSVEIGKSLAA